MKFRCWDTILKGFVKSDECYINGEGDVFAYDKMEGGIISVANYIPQRFTELYDIYGTPIYEGDLVKLHFTHENIRSDIYTVNYKYGKWLLDDYNSLNNYWVDCKKWGDTCKVVIIGNIFDK
jgi:hypothetical protein